MANLVHYKHITKLTSTVIRGFELIVDPQIHITEFVDFIPDNTSFRLTSTSWPTTQLTNSKENYHFCDGSSSQTQWKSFPLFMKPKYVKVFNTIFIDYIHDNISSHSPIITDQVTNKFPENSRSWDGRISSRYSKHLPLFMESKYIKDFKKARHLPLSPARSVQFKSSFYSLKISF